MRELLRLKGSIASRKGSPAVAREPLLDGSVFQRALDGRPLEAQANLRDAIRRASDSYAGGLSAVMTALESLPRPGGEAPRHVVEEWLNLARASKEEFVAAVSHGFDRFEWECRRAVGVPPPPANGPPRETWPASRRQDGGSFAPGRGSSDGHGDAARKQAEAVRRALEDGIRARRPRQPSSEPERHRGAPGVRGSA